MVPCLRLLLPIHRRRTPSFFIFRCSLQEQQQTIKQHGSQSTALTFEAPISVQRTPRRFPPPLFYSTVVLLFCIISPRVPLPLRSRLWTSDQRLRLRPSYYPFSCPSRHHIRTSIATSPPLILRAMLNISALQQRACYDLYSRLAIDHDHQRHYSSRTSHAYSQSRLAVSSSHLTFDGKLTFFGLMKRFLARVYGRIFLCFSPRLCPAGWLVRLHALWRILSRWIVHKVPFWLEYVCESLEC